MSAAGHLGINTTTKRLLTKYYHVRPTYISTRYIAKCLECARKRKTIGAQLQTQRNVMRTNQAQFCMQVIYLDFYGPLHTTPDGFKHILTAKCSYSKYLWLTPTRNQETDTIVSELEKNIFAYWGLCDKIISDNQIFTN